MIKMDPNHGINMIYIDLQILSLLPFRFHDGLSPATDREHLPRVWPKIKEVKKVLPCV